MFASFKGKVIKIANEKVITEVGGVGYLLSCSARTISQLEVNQAAFLLAETIVREDQISIYGFIDELEQGWFNLLTTVKGIGPKIALQVLGQVDLGTLGQEIAIQNKNIFKNISGIGTKTAERIILELKDKVLPQGDSVVIVENKNNVANNQQYDDAIVALTTLGYQRNEAYRAVSTIHQNDNNLQTREIIKLALKELSK